MTRETISRVLFIPAVLAGLIGTAARGAPIYHVTFLGTPDPAGLDNQGRVYLNETTSTPYQIPQGGRRPAVGYTETTTALRYEPYGPNAGTYTGLGAGVPKGQPAIGSPSDPGSVHIDAVAPNGRALVDTASGTFVTDGTAAVKQEPNVGGAPRFVAVNSAGQVLLNVPGQDASTATAVGNGQSVHVLGNLGGNYSNPTALSDNGNVAGTGWIGPNSYGQTSPVHAFLYHQGTLTDVGTLGGSFGTTVRGVNDAGQVVGVSPTGDPGPGGTNVLHAFLYGNGTMKDLGVLPGMQDSAALAINHQGQVVGQSGWKAFFDDPTATHTVAGIAAVKGDPPDLPSDVLMHVHATGMYNLTDLIDPSYRQSHPNFGLSSAIAINDPGQVLAFGYDIGRSPGVYLLTPEGLPPPVDPAYTVPEPGGLAVFGAALLALGAWRGRSRPGNRPQ